MIRALLLCVALCSPCLGADLPRADDAAKLSDENFKEIHTLARIFEWNNLVDKINLAIKHGNHSTGEVFIEADYYEDFKSRLEGYGYVVKVTEVGKGLGFVVKFIITWGEP